MAHEFYYHEMKVTRYMHLIPLTIPQYSFVMDAFIRIYTLYCKYISTVCSSFSVFVAQADLIVICLADLILQMSDSTSTG